MRGAGAGAADAGVLAGGVAFLGAAKALRIEELETLRNFLPGGSRTTSCLR